MSDLDDLYQSVILDHDRRPRNFREIEGECQKAEGHNPLCGDRFTVMLKVENGVIADASFTGAGCAISKASASMMTETLKGKTVAEANRLFERFQEELTGAGAASDGLPGKLKVFQGVTAFPMRVKCATLAWHAMRKALEN
ncbi:MAG TPA: SUF system NifU family Fe-S cluster assembly protein [Gemmatimonadales bacterium]|nr:SUF system NifU family Fe-S cluster assembly protein [Gemmatimonadales bacterium]